MSDKDGKFLADIYVELPGKDCGAKNLSDSPCGSALCRDFARVLLNGTKEVYDCPYMEDENRQAILLVLNDYY